MMKKKIAAKDLEVLRRLFIPATSEVRVLDTKNRFETNPFTQEEEEQSKGLGLFVSGDSKAVQSDDVYDRIIQFDSSKGIQKSFKREFRFISLNGSIRWIYPKGQMSAVIEFYHSSTKRAKLATLGLRILGAFRLDGLIAKKMTIHSDVSNCIEVGPKDQKFDDFSVFMGTPGVERTALLGFITRKKSTHFLKVGISTIARMNVANEGNVLFRLENESFEKIVLPCIRSTEEGGVISISKLNAKKKRLTNVFVKEHANALIELGSLSRSSMRFDESQFGERIMDNCNIIDQSSTENTKLENLILKGFKNIRYNEFFTGGIAHGDFTPWNMFLSENKLHLYDWESSIRFAPLLFDLFHYHFQAGIFLKKWSFNQINTQIKFAIESNESILQEIKTHSIDIKKHMQLYLLYTASRKLALTKIKGGKEIIPAHQRVVWEEAMIYVLPVRVGNRKSFIAQFDFYLRGVQHAFLKFDAGKLSALPPASDLDLAIHSGDLSSAVDFCTNHEDVKRFKSVKKSFMTTLELFFHDNGYLSIDFIHDFRRKSVRFMNINDLLYAASRNANGIVVPALHHDVEYALMFYTLNGASVPEKYIALFDQADKASKLNTLRYFSKRFDLNCASLTELLTSFDACEKAFKKKLSTDLRPSILGRLVAKARYVQDTVKDRIGRRGFTLTFSGVDGVGKTTIIDIVKEQLESKYRKEVVLMRHRPKVLPILSAFKYGSVSKAENKTTHLEPNEVTSKSALGSYLRFSYYYLDYLLGQFYVQARYVWAGKIVLYDRYYFDIINHPQRTNLTVNPKFAKMLYRPIIKPTLNVFLCASPDEIVKRKQELDVTQISSLTTKYLHLFGEFSRDNTSARYVVHRNDDLSNTVTGILQDIQQIA